MCAANSHSNLRFLTSQVHHLRLMITADTWALPVAAACVRGAILRAPDIHDATNLLQEALDALQAAWLSASIAGTAVELDLAIDPVLHQIVIQLDPGWHWVGAYEAHTEVEERQLPAEDASLGVGLFLVRRVMDRVEYFPQPGANRWRLCKRLDFSRTTDTEEIRTIHLDIPACYRYLNVVGECIAAMLPEDEQTSGAIQLAVHEICTNIVEHAYYADHPGRIEITLTRDPVEQTFQVETHDTGGHTFDLSLIPDRFDLAAPTLRSPLLTGSLLLFISATLVNGGNYLFNLLLGRWLGPASFADLSLIVTLFLVTSFVTMGLQTPVARFGALYAADHDLQAISNLRRWARRRALVVGAMLMTVLTLGASFWANFFATASFWPFVIFGAFLPFYLLQGVDRGLLQGRTQFGRLAATYQTEMWSRLAFSLLFVALGWGVSGAVLGIGLSFVATWAMTQQIGRQLPKPQPVPASIQKELLLFTGPVLVAQLGQILINNGDILIVKRFFPAEEAGMYAALALIGRMVFFATWSIVTAMFPIVAQRFQRGEAHRPLFYASLGLVLAGSLLIIGATALFPHQIVHLLFGEAYQGIAPLLWVYALATMFYALANVVITYRLSIGSAGGVYLAIIAGIAQTAMLWFWHESLAQVVWVQVALMGFLFLALLTWDLGNRERKQAPQVTPAIHVA